MKQIKLLSLLMLLILFTTNIAFSQGSSSFHIGATLPMGDFADDDLGRDKSGGAGAGAGVGIGLEYIYPLTETGLGVFAGIDFNYNGLQKDVKDEIEEMLGEGDVDIKYFKYINIPLSAGLNYTFKADEKLSVYGNVGLVANFLKITNYSVEFDGNSNVENTTEFDLANSFGYKIGGGIVLNDKTTLSINYFGLGEPEVTANIEYDEEFDMEDTKIKQDKPIDFLTITIGFKF